MGILDIFKGGLSIGKQIGDAAEGVGDGVSKIVSTAKGEIPPEVQGEIEKVKAQQRTEIARITQEAVDSFRGFVLEHSGTAEQIPQWLLVWRSLVRPVITTALFLWFLGILTVDLWNAVVRQVPDYVWILTILPQGFWVLIGIVFGFWFGERAGTRISQAFKQGGE